jgi:hypothetical protein
VSTAHLDGLVNGDDYFLIGSAFIGPSGPLSASRHDVAGDRVAMRGEKPGMALRLGECHIPRYKPKERLRA